MKTNLLLCFALILLAGCQTSTPPQVATISFAWSYPTDDYVRGKASVNAEIVYVGADDNAMHAVNANTGEALWRYETLDNITSTPAVYGDMIYFGSWDGTINAVGAEEGEPRWQYQTDGWVAASREMEQAL